MANKRQQETKKMEAAQQEAERRAVDVLAQMASGERMEPPEGWRKKSSGDVLAAHTSEQILDCSNARS